MNDLQVAANTILLLVALFLTTPEFIVTQLDVILIYIFGGQLGILHECNWHCCQQAVVKTLH